VARPTAGVGHGGEQRLVEVVADPDGGGADAGLAGLVGQPDERPRLGDADVGQPVGQQQDAPDGLPAAVAAVGPGAPQLLEPLEPPARQVGRPARLQVPQRREEPVDLDRRQRSDVSTSWS
jgi:hypothetical protein